MDIVALTTKLATDRVANQNSIQSAKNVQIQQKQQQSQKAIALIESAGPYIGESKGSLIDIYA